ncbi:MAG TPA: prephenate dehydratase domain-containing protein [Clostridia bacterium]|nr:prephenate dehydratase domain-containing protein [Clostridia bacterium]
MNIEELRKEIDNLDDEIACLYDKRMEIVKEIGMEKALDNKNVLDTSREKEVINRVTKQVKPEIKVFTKMLYTTIFDTSKAYQSRFAHLSSNIGEQIQKVLAEKRESFPEYATVACQGVQGAYSQMAAERLFVLSDITYLKNFEGVFNAVQKGLCSFGILPIENSSVGSVNAVYELMKKYNFHIVKSIKLPIRHSLLAKKGVKISDIKEIVSHEQGIEQCNQYIQKLGNVKVTYLDNTALAAKFVQESNRNDIAAISSKQCADLYGLAVLDNGIQDNDSNFTRFICISKQLKIFRNANKISMMVNLAHEPGSLNKLLSKFTSLGLSLTKIESIPLPNTDFEFMFYFDFEADIEREEVQNLLAELDNRSEKFIFLGSYNEVI